MSLARGFILAGASSVIRTSWEVNDETSATIISRFYYYLSKGKYKDEAMRQAKLDYLKATPPAFTSPYFWAAYEVLGDNTPVAVNNEPRDFAGNNLPDYFPLYPVSLFQAAKDFC